MNYAAFLVKNRKSLIMIGLTVIILVLAYFAFKKKKLKKVELPSGGHGIPIIGIDAGGNVIPWNPGPISGELFNVMDGIWTFGSTKDIAFAKGLALTNDQLVAVYNDFNTNYGSGDSLTVWVDGEWNKGIKGDAFLEKLRGLGLT